MPEPLSQSQFMTMALREYYRTHESVGQDFTTAPEISQVFGELIGAWSLDYFTQLGCPEAITFVELGPGQGTLMADLLRVGRLDPNFLKALNLYLVETSPILKAKQKALLPSPLTWLESFNELPKSSSPLLIIANEFFDALPTNLWERKDNVLFERYVGEESGQLIFHNQERGMDKGPDALWEDSPVANALLHCICSQLVSRSGAFLCIDYGYEEGQGDTLQALYQGAPSPPLHHIGKSDLTCHVNFKKLGEIARSYGLGVAGPCPQGSFLKALGIDVRFEALKAKNPSQHAVLEAAHIRLTHPLQMGTLFKALAVFSPPTLTPAGFL